MKKILSSLLVVFVTLISAINITSSFFSDSEISSGNTFQSGEFDLLVNGQDNPQSIINFIDIKPGDYLTEEKILTIQNPAFAWLHLNELETSQGVETEPEIIDENGVEKHDLENYLLYDLVVGSNNPIISLDDQISFSDVFSCWIPLGNIDVGDTTVLQSFHFEDTVTNWAQGDTLTFSEEFYAEQNRHNPSPTPPNSIIF